MGPQSVETHRVPRQCSGRGNGPGRDAAGLAAPTTMGMATRIVSRVVAVVWSWIAVRDRRIAVGVIIIWRVAAAVIRGRDRAAYQSAGGQCARGEPPSTMPAAPAAVPSAETHLYQVPFLRHRIGSCG